MKKYFLVASLLVLLLGFTRITPAAVAEEEIAYPEGYRRWTHVKTGLVGPENPGFKVNGGYHHIYANEKAMQGFLTGYFPEQSVLVFDVLEAVSQNGNLIEGKRTHIDVMVKDSVRFATTGGWGYEEFKEDSHSERLLTAVKKTQCFNCHTKQPDFVFSDFRK